MLTFLINAVSLGLLVYVVKNLGHIKRKLRRIEMNQEELNAVETSMSAKLDAIAAESAAISDAITAETAEIKAFIANAPDALDTSGLVALNERLGALADNASGFAARVGGIFTPEPAPSDTPVDTPPVDPTVDPAPSADGTDG